MSPNTLGKSQLHLGTPKPLNLETRIWNPGRLSIMDQSDWQEYQGKIERHFPIKLGQPRALKSMNFFNLFTEFPA